MEFRIKIDFKDSLKMYSLFEQTIINVLKNIR